ncbi:MAG: bifunctional (p)ppGpp synthetase/guanosine-3',5'-bis(diphosphate) 3'-pyrophosphohydrolase, partial [Deltaproteobacteria bacterium]|nr:bifunctional (p)ppGpp synthetase/guanosine-3',5'-bis(diphosphate) 3'-pyrophosphohydrolase [Deltaproteobacteria bacterium]
ERLTVANIYKSEPLLAIAEELSFHSVEDLLAQIGIGKLSPRQVVGRLKPRLGIKEEKTPGLVTKMVGRIKRRKADPGIKVKGVDGMLIHFANCCHALPGESVIGFITRGRGITIHHENCRHIRQAAPERLVDVSWDSSEENAYPVKLRVTSVEGKGVLADISAVITLKDA